MASPPDVRIAKSSRDIRCRGMVAPRGVLGPAAQFVAMFWRRLGVVSALVLLPCFWNREIEAADLGSHLYNAWLAELIHRGQLHGLWIDHRWNNILFDYLLSGFAVPLGLHTAEKIAVASCVLVFFWGAFALACAATRRAPWGLLPLMAMAAYGWTFHIGLFNYYLALGLSFFALAILWRGKPAEWLITLAIAPLIVLAHPLALFWLISAGVYVVAAERVPRVYHLGLLVAGVLALFGFHAYLWSHYVVEARPHDFWFFNGADQFVLFGNRYRIIEYAFLTFIATALAGEFFTRRQDRNVRPLRERSDSTVDAETSSRPGAAGRLQHSHTDLRPTGYAILIEMYVLVGAAVLLLPRGAHVPGHIGAVALLTDRLTSVSVVLLICMAAAARPQRRHLIAGSVLAAVFFGFVYQDTGRVNRMEATVAQIVRTLPRGQRVMGTILPPPDSRVTIQHILDRACIGYCYSYGNYEPGSKMFRVRAVPGNPYVLADYDLAIEMERGTYVVQPADLPVWEVYQCDAQRARVAAPLLSDATFCIAPLHAGERNLPSAPGQRLNSNN